MFQPHVMPDQPVADELDDDEDPPVLADEIREMRHAVQRLARGGVGADTLKELAELRHQVDALCKALKTEHDVAAARGDPLERLYFKVSEQVLDEEEAARNAVREGQP